MSKTLKDHSVDFNFKLKKTLPLTTAEYIDLEQWRALFFRIKLVGLFSNSKTSFGNLSKRVPNTVSLEPHFIITGVNTGAVANADGSQYAKVTSCDLKRKKILAQGTYPPSNQALLHYALYEQTTAINTIFIIRSMDIYQKLMSEGKFINFDENYNQFNIIPKIDLYALSDYENFVLALGMDASSNGRSIMDALKAAKKP